jgi:hypothetical protein
MVRKLGDDMPSYTAADARPGGLASTPTSARVQLAVLIRKVSPMRVFHHPDPMSLAQTDNACAALLAPLG